MRRPGPAVWVVVLALCAWYGARAVGALARAGAHAGGRRAFAAVEHERAARLLPRAVGDGRQAAELWYLGQATLGVYRERLAASAENGDLDTLLATAYRSFTEAIARSPASGWYWAGLSDVYHERERRTRARFGAPLAAFGDEPLASLGRDGRVALGALRLALRREPTQFVFHDQMALLFFDYRLDHLALEAVEDAARVQPLFEQHLLAGIDPQPPGVLDAFARGARAALGATPLLRPVDHHIALGRIELARGRYADAVSEFDLALESPHPALQGAEARYHRSRALELLGRIDEAREDLERAGRHPVFVRGSLLGLARIEEQAGRLDRALEHLRSLRRSDPADLETLLELSRIAARHDRFDEARQALEWAATRYPTDPRPVVRLADLRLAAGELVEAGEALERLRALAPEDPETVRVARAFDAARAR